MTCAVPRGGAPGTEGVEDGADGTTVDAAGGTGRRGGRGSGGTGSAAVGGGDGTVRSRQVVDSGSEVAKAYAPYVIIIAIFSLTNLPAVKEALAAEPWTYT